MRKITYTHNIMPKKPLAWFSLLVMSVVLATSVAGIISFRIASNADALSGSQFQAGSIIDNGVFFDSTPMSAIDIQNFLNAKVPACDTNGSQIYSGSTTRAQHGAANGNPAPYTCLKDYRQDTPNMPSENGLCSAFPAGNRSAAQIIRDVGGVCGVNPQVLLVLLQKEQSLITDTWPWNTQYNSATGFGCPDTAPCDSSVAGFFYQVYYAARQFKKYARDAYQYNYFANSNNKIQYSPIASCGSSTVYIQNQATAGLYVYTPYQPNAAALNNLYGTGDGCSAYGNRNFWRMFNDWFGSTHAAPFAWQPASQEFYADSQRTTLVNTYSLAASTTYYLRLRAQNMGNSTWHNSGGSSNNQINLGTNNPNNRSSAFADSSWPLGNRAAVLKEASVAPGEFGTFEFSIKTPASYGFYKEYFNLVAEGQTWMNDAGLYWPMQVSPPTPLWQAFGQELFTDSGRTVAANSSALAADTTYYVRARAQNIGNTNWTNSGNNPTRLGTNSPVDRSSSFKDNSWTTTNRAATLKESLVKPGEAGTFEFSIHTPNTYGSYKEYFKPVVEGSAWMNDLGMYLPLSVIPPTPLWQYSGQATYTNSSKTTAANLSAIANGSRFYVVLQAKNVGNTTWKNSGATPTLLGTASPGDRTSPFCDSSTWISCNRAAVLKEASVAPGDIGTFEFWMQAPFKLDGTYFKEYFRPVVEGAAWMNDLGSFWPITMQSSAAAWQYSSQGAYTDSARTIPANLANATTNTTYYLRLKAKNTSGSTWTKGGNTPLNLGTTNPDNRTSSLCDNSTWISCNRPTTLKEASVAPGDIGTFDFTIRTPSSAVSINEYLRPVIDGKTWLNDLGVYWQVVTH